VQKFTTSGAFLGAIGTAGAGNGQLDTPDGIALGPNGQVYVCDRPNVKPVLRFR